MAASFAAYASQYLNRQQQQPAEASLLSSSHPMFFSFSTEDGSRGGHGPDSALLDDYDLDDPHLNLRESEESESTARRPTTGAHRGVEGDDENDDPYLRLDEDERTGRYGFDSRSRQQSAPLIAADDAASVSSSSGGSTKGWLAHLAASPSLHMAAPTPRPARSSSPAHSSSSESGPPPELFGGPSTRKGEQRRQQQQHHHHHSTVPNQQHYPAPPPRTHRNEPHSLSLTESLLPRDGRARPLDVFSLPDPRHAPRGRRKYSDSIWTSAWLAGVTICVLSAIILLFAAQQPDRKVPRRVLPYVTLLHTVPLLTILTVVSAAVAYVHIFLLQIFVRPVMVATSVFIPVTLLISALWAFIGSFMWEEGTDPTWGETVGLRLFSIIPLLLAIYTGRRLLNLPQQIHTTSSTLTLTTHLLLTNPFLLALSPAILLGMLLASIPFLTLIFRLLLIGYATHVGKDASGWEWHVKAWANWAIAAAVGVWLWTWGVARGTMRMVTASVIGAWYFADINLPPPPPASTHTIHSALFRATGQSLGTTALSALILASIRLLTLLTLLLQRAPLYLPLRVVAIVMPAIRWIVGYIDGVTTALSRYALVYTGLTGDAFMASARRSRALTRGVESGARAGSRGRGFGKEPPLTLLTISPLVLTFPFALITYLFVAHTLKAPNEALGAAVLGGGVTALVGLFCVGLVKDTADTLYLCYCIDKDTGGRKREEVFVIFEPETTGRGSGRSGSQAQAGGQPQPVNPPTNNTRGKTQPQQASAQHQHPEQQQQQQHRRPPSFGASSAKAALTPFSAAGSKTQPLVSGVSPFLSDEDSPREGEFSRVQGRAEGGEEVDPFKKSFVDGEDDADRGGSVVGIGGSRSGRLGGSGTGDVDDIYEDEDEGQGFLQRVQQQPQFHLQQQQQPPTKQLNPHQRVGSGSGGGGGMLGLGLGRSPPVPVNAFLSRNRGSSGSVAFSSSPPGVGGGAGFSKSPPRVGGTGAAVSLGGSGERMKTSAEMNMKSHVLQARGRDTRRAGGVDDDSDSDAGSDRAEGSGIPRVNLSPRRLGDPGRSGLGEFGFGGGKGSGVMDGQDVNPFEAAGDAELGLSKGGNGKDLEESDLYPGSGFFG